MKRGGYVLTIVAALSGCDSGNSAEMESPVAPQFTAAAQEDEVGQLVASSRGACLVDTVGTTGAIRLSASLRPEGGGQIGVSGEWSPEGDITKATLMTHGPDRTGIRYVYFAQSQTLVIRQLGLMRNWDFRDSVPQRIPQPERIVGDQAVKRPEAKLMSQLLEKVRPYCSSGEWHEEPGWLFRGRKLSH